MDEFGHAQLIQALHDRSVVRGGLLRGTQHLCVAADYLWMRPLLARRMGNFGLSAFRRQLEGVDLAELTQHARDVLAGRTMTRPQLARALAEWYPGRETIALAWAAQHQLALVHPPPSGIWRRRGHVHVALAEDWIGAPLEKEAGEGGEGVEGTARRDAHVQELFRRYLAGCGPATAADFQNWSGLRRVREEVEAMRAQLRVYVDDAGRELFDLPELELADPDEDDAVPVRFLPEFDNLVLSHEDRSRIIREPGDRALICPGYSIVRPTFLEDGFVAGTWTVERGTLEVQPFRPLRDPAAVVAEGERLLAFLEEGQGADRVRIR